jgi:pimeloyl-ACP methyl ester carboxylesterase
MQNVLVALIRGFAAVALVAPAFNIQPAFAQNNRYIPATPAGEFARYYAPYAIQAAAAYVDTARLDATRGTPGNPAVEGADVEHAVNYVSSDSTFVDRAKKYLRSWRYQFGSEGYLTCFERDPECLQAIKDDRWTFAVSGGPTFHVWARFPEKRRVACSEVSIAFRGTVFSSFADWTANLSPTWLRADDHYRQLRRNIDPIIKKITTLDCYRRAGTQIVSVGHSLGGGLAQLAALGNNPTRHRIAKVFAFDPSPITGESLLGRGLREGNAANLEIDRIYQSGEVLAFVRKAYQQFPPANSPCVRTVLYDVSAGINVVALHNMNTLAREIVQQSYSVSGNQKGLETPIALRCGQYKAPKHDQDDYDAPPSDRGPGEVAAQPVGPAGRTTQIIPGRGAASYARADGFEFTPSQPATMDNMVAKLVSEKHFGGARVAGAYKAQRHSKRRIPAVRVSHHSAQL